MIQDSGFRGDKGNTVLAFRFVCYLSPNLDVAQRINVAFTTPPTHIVNMVIGSSHRIFYTGIMHKSTPV